MRTVGTLIALACVLSAAPGASARTGDAARCCFHASVHVKGSMLVDYGGDPADPANGRQEMAWDWRAREIVTYRPRGEVADNGRRIPGVRPVRRRTSRGSLDLPAKIRYRFRERSSITTRSIDGTHAAPGDPCRDRAPTRGETVTNGPDSVAFASDGWRFAAPADLAIFEITLANGNHPAVPAGRLAVSAILSRTLDAFGDSNCGPGGWTHTVGEDSVGPLHPPGLAPWIWIQAAAPSDRQFRRSRRISRTVTWRVNPPLAHDQPPHVATQEVRATFTFTWFHPKRLRAETRRFLRR